MNVIDLLVSTRELIVMMMAIFIYHDIWQGKPRLDRYVDSWSVHFDQLLDIFIISSLNPVPL